jgi:hypothetical protein
VYLIRVASGSSRTRRKSLAYRITGGYGAEISANITRHRTVTHR